MLADGLNEGRDRRFRRLDRDVKIRRTKWGPVLSDIPQLSKYIGPDVALQWMGYWPSDEVTAMLKANNPPFQYT